jgi:hypothetical protein
MLAQNFKTATDLGITDAEHEALTKVLGMLERDEIRHAPINYDKSFYMRKPAGVKHIDFNMGEVFSHTACGTAACIAGSCDFFFKTRFSSSNALRDDLPDALNALFCPDTLSGSEWEKITAEQAARALRSYLTTGEANWADALASQRPLQCEKNHDQKRADTRASRQDVFRRHREAARHHAQRRRGVCFRADWDRSVMLCSPKSSGRPNKIGTGHHGGGPFAPVTLRNDAAR